VNLLQLDFYGVDGFGEGAGAGGEADAVIGGEHVGAEIGGGFDVEGADAGVAGAGDELLGVIGIAPPYHDEDGNLFEESLEGGLTVARGLANGIDEADLGSGVEGADLGDDGASVVLDGGGLGHDADAGLVVTPHSHLSFDDVEAARGQIAGEAADFDVALFADDEDEEAGLGEGEGGVMGFTHEGAGGVNDLSGLGVSAGEEGAFMVGDAVGGDEDLGGGDGIGGAAFGFFDLTEAAAGHFAHDGRIMDELAEDGDLGGGLDGAHGIEGVADAETEAHGLGGNDLHRTPHDL
jgi:hypothetical protein